MRLWVYLSIGWVIMGTFWPLAGNYVYIATLCRQLCVHLCPGYVIRVNCKGQCHKIFECWFQKTNYFSWSHQRYPGTIVPVSHIAEYLTPRSILHRGVAHYKATQRCILHRLMVTPRCILRIHILGVVRYNRESIARIMKTTTALKGAILQKSTRNAHFY